MANKVFSISELSKLLSSASDVFISLDFVISPILYVSSTIKSLGNIFEKHPIIFEENLYWANFDVEIIDISIIVSVINIIKIRNEFNKIIVDFIFTFGLIVKIPARRIL